MVEVAADGIEGIGPGVAGIGREALQDGHGHERARGLVAVLERAGHLGRVGEARFLVEEAGDLEIGVEARLEAAEELQEEALAVLQGGVGLLDAHDVRLELLRAAQFLE
jgi:hypothetical protein